MGLIDQFGLPNAAAILPRGKGEPGLFFAKVHEPRFWQQPRPISHNEPDISRRCVKLKRNIAPEQNIPRLIGPKQMILPRWGRDAAATIGRITTLFQPNNISPGIVSRAADSYEERSPIKGQKLIRNSHGVRKWAS